MRKEGCVILFTRDWEKNKKHFQIVEIGNDILIYINIKQVLQMEIHAANETLICLNATGPDS